MVAVAIFGVAFIAIIAVIASIISVMNYIFTGFGLMKMGETMGEKAPWLSWIPYANQFLIGKLAINNTAGIILIVSNLIMGVLGMMLGILINLVENTADFEMFTIPLAIFGIITAIFGIAIAVFTNYVYYRLYKKFSDKATMMTIFTVLTGTGIAPIFLFAIRNNELRE